MIFAIRARACCLACMFLAGLSGSAVLYGHTAWVVVTIFSAFLGGATIVAAIVEHETAAYARRQRILEEKRMISGDPPELLH